MTVMQKIINCVVQTKDVVQDGCRNKYLTILGCFLIQMNNGVFWYWANMSVDCMSYFVSALNITYGVQSPLVYSFFMVQWTLGMLVSGTVASKIGRPLTVLLGMTLFDGGIFLSYFTVQSSLPALTATMGIATGIGTGLMDGSALQLALDWSGTRTGLVTCILQGAISLGGFLINQIVTLYTNPENLVPNFYLGRTTYFTQKEVLDRVPSMFLVVGCYCLCLHLIGFVMIREKPDSIDVEKMTEDTTLVQSKNNEYTIKGYDLESNVEIDEASVATGEQSSADPETEIKDYTYKEILKTKSFYTCWMSLFAYAMSFMLIGVYYKAFGQIWIKNDYFMTNIAAMMSIGNSMMSAMLGFLIDLFGAKNCSVFATGLMCVVLFWYYFTPMVSQWLYMVTVLLFVCLAGPMFACYTTLTARMYGKKYFTTNFGLVMTSQLVFNVISPYFVDYLLTAWGWFAMYTFNGALLAVNLVPMILFLPNV